MRITCPNCGAQYEVPDEVIPAEGRDVQCSNCGDTWFQTQSGPRADDAEEEDDDSFSGFDEPEDDEPENAFSREEYNEPPVRRQRRQLDPGVAGILREEAEHEARIRARDADPLESQGDLGLDAYPGESTERRSDEAQEGAQLLGALADPVDPFGQRQVLVPPFVQRLRGQAGAEPAQPVCRAFVGGVERHRHR